MSDLTDLAHLILRCPDCRLCETRTTAVPGEGPEDARIMFIGEAPGFNEDKTGRPFVGAAGKFLDQLLGAAGLRREDVFIANVVKCFISPRVLIYTLDGYKPIKDVRIGELVLTHEGRFRPVTYVRPREILPKGSDVVRITVRADTADPGNRRPVSISVTPEHPFLVNGEWRTAAEISPGDRVRVLGDRCEICQQPFFVRYERYENRSYRTCSTRCHNVRVFHSSEARANLRRTMLQQYEEGSRDRFAITARANARTRELVAAGEAKVQHWTSEERHRGRLALALRINEGKAKHRIGYGEYELITILDRLGVPYQHHFALPHSTLSYDFCLPEQQILIEVRGPGFLQNGDTHGRALFKDRLAWEHGFIVLNLIWSQIVEQPDMVESLLNRLMRNHAGEYVFVDLGVVEAERRRTRRDFPLYNIGVADDESYVAAGLVSHNCRPPNNRDPMPDEIEACSKWLDRQIEIIDPKVIVTLGRHSMNRFIPGAVISRIHGVPREIDGRTVVPMFHPAAALHQERYRSMIVADFERLPQILATAEERLANAEAAPTPPPAEPEPVAAEQGRLF